MPKQTGITSIFHSSLPRLPESATGIRLKLERANKHIDELNGVLNSFYATKPYRIAIKKDSRTREEVFYLAKIEPVPDLVPIIAGDILQNIRSALDHLAFILYGITKPGQTDDIVYFPIAKSSTTYNSSGFRGKVECFGRDIAKRIDDIKPYKGGNNFLWRLHELNKIDKHRLLISAVSGIQLRSMIRADYDRIRIANPTLYRFLGCELVDWTKTGLPSGPLKVGDELYRGSPLKAEEKKNFKFRIEVAFNEPKIDEREPVIHSLYHFSMAVENVCRGFADLLLIHKPIP